MNHRRPIKHDLSFALTPILEVPHVLHAVILSADGLIEAQSPNLTQEIAEGCAAMLSALQASARAASTAFAGTGTSSSVRQTMVETDHGWLFLIPAGQSTYLGVYARVEVDMRMVTYTMQKQVQTLGKAMVSPPRQEADQR